MDYKVLGPLEVRHRGRLVPVRGQKQRGLLALLLTSPASWVARADITDLLWPGLTVRKNTVQVLVSRLRQSLGSGAGLVSEEDRYRLEQVDQLDAQSFEEFQAMARRAMTNGHPEAAAAASRQALDLWRGPAF